MSSNVESQLQQVKSSISAKEQKANELRKELYNTYNEIQQSKRKESSLESQLRGASAYNKDPFFSNDVRGLVANTCGDVRF